MMYVEQWMYGDIVCLAYMYLQKYMHSEICILFIAILLI